MRLHVDEHGVGPKVCVLVHGMMGSAESWWRVTPELVEAGYRVLALDLPGHGRSDRDRSLTVERAADSVVETIGELTSQAPAVAIGHSFGGAVLAAAASRLRPQLAVYVDAPFASRGGYDFAETAEEYELDRQQRTAVKLRESRRTTANAIVKLRRPRPSASIRSPRQQSHLRMAECGSSPRDQ